MIVFIVSLPTMNNQIKSAATQPNKSELRLLSRKNVAEILGLSVPTVKRYQQQGLLRPIVVNARLVRYRYEDIIDFVNQSAA